MRRLAQPGWMLFQAAIIGFWLYAWYVAQPDGDRTNYMQPVVIGLVCSWGATVVLLILNEGRKDVLRLIRRLTSGEAARAASEDRLERPRSPAPLGQRKPEVRLPGGR